MASAKRRFDRGPVPMAVYEFHNKHRKETWADVKRTEPKPPRQVAHRDYEDE